MPQVFLRLERSAPLQPSSAQQQLYAPQPPYAPVQPYAPDEPYAPQWRARDGATVPHGADQRDAHAQ